MTPGLGNARLLVFAPHPDDAALATAGLMQRYDQVTICHVTAGDGYWRAAVAYEGRWFPSGADYLALGRQRWREAQASAQTVQATPILLGFPDACLMEVLRSAIPYTSPFTRVHGVPYTVALQPGLPYTGANLIAAFRQVITHVNPDLIAAPTVIDENETHKATAWALQQVQPAVPVWSYLVHADHGLWPGLGLDWNRVMRSDDLPKPHISIPLSRHQERVKYQAIGVHTTQMEVLGPWLNAFVAKNELYQK